METSATGHSTEPADDETAEPERLRALPGRLLGMVSYRAQQLIGEALATADARKYHFALLVTLEEFGPASQASLSRRTGIYRSDMVATINELSERGYVERAPDPADGRRNIITVTPAGLAQLERLTELFDEAHGKLLAPLSQPECDELMRLLHRLRDYHAPQWD